MAKEKINEQGSKKEKPVEKEAKKEDTKAKAPAKTETKPKVEEKKPEPKVVKKDKAVALGRSLRISPKYSVAICKVLMRKTPEAAVARLEAVINERRPIPMAGLEVAHQKGKGLSGAKFPKNACKAIIAVVKQAGANASVNGIDNPIIVKAIANRAAAPFKSGGRKAKRTHVMIEVVDKSKLTQKKK